MSGFNANPFADAENPFADPSVTRLTGTANKPSGLEDYNPFAEKPTSAATRPTPVAEPARASGFTAAATITATPVPQPSVAPPQYAPSPAQQVDTAELQRRQEELERKAAELQQREEQLRRTSFNPRADNWPPLPKFCPKPCFYQDFEVDIPSEFRRTVRIMYYLWIAYSVILFINFVFSLMAYIVLAQNTTGNNAGVGFGLSILWLMLYTPASFLCWYRPVYKAFRSDSSINFFFFFFVFFIQCIVTVVMALGIDGSGYAGWIVSFELLGLNSTAKAVGGAVMFMAIIFTVQAAACIVMLIRIVRSYRRTGASFAQAQKELAQGVFTSPGVQAAAGQAVAAAATGYMSQPTASGGKY